MISVTWAERWGSYATQQFETESGKQLDDRIIGSVEVLNDKICIVPHGINPQKLQGRDYLTPRTYEVEGKTVTHVTPGTSMLDDSLRESHAGDLIAIPSNETIMMKVEPFDGSGMSPGKHLTANGKVYIHHGNWPNERITIRDLTNGEVVKEIPLMTSYGFAEHEGVVYDVRMCPGDGQRERITRVLRSDEGYKAKPIFEQPDGEEITSIASGGIDGLLVALYSGVCDQTRIVTHRNPTQDLIRINGVVRIRKA